MLLFKNDIEHQRSLHLSLTLYNKREMSRRDIQFILCALQTL